MTVLNIFLLWTAQKTNMTHRLTMFPLTKLILNQDCGVSASDRRFSTPKNISKHRHVTNSLLCLVSCGMASSKTMENS